MVKVLLNSRTVITLFSLFQIFREVENFSKGSGLLSGIGGGTRRMGEHATEDHKIKKGNDLKSIPNAIGDDRRLHVPAVKDKDSDSLEADYADTPVTSYPEENPSLNTDIRDDTAKDEADQLAAGQKTASCILKQVEIFEKDWFGLRPTLELMMSRSRKIMTSFSSFLTQLTELNFVGALGDLAQLIAAFTTLFPSIAELPTRVVTIMSRVVPQMTFGTVSCVAGGSSDTLRQIASFVGNQLVFGR